MKLLRYRLLVLGAVFSANSAFPQSFNFSCTLDTFIGRCQNPQCFTLKVKIPDIHASSNSYTVNPIGETPTSCFPFYIAPNDPTGDSASLNIDDQYSNALAIGFPFPFYGNTYTQVIASPNGMISFDISRANHFAHYGILKDVNNILNASNGIPEDLPSSLYDAAIIMGPYHDLDPEYTSSPNRVVQYKVIGTAPYRKWIISYYKMPLYLIPSGCNLLIENTHQIVLYESTGIIEVLLHSMEICANWNQGRAMIGIQNFAKDQALMVTGHRASDAPWGAINMYESWRFVPAAGASLFKRVELYDSLGNFIMTGTATSLGTGKMEADFPNICPAIGTTTTYIVKSVYSKFNDPSTEIYGMDTVRITKGASTDLNATGATTNSACFNPTGTITLTVPTITANPPYTYVLNGGLPVTGNAPHTFFNLPAGNDTVLITDASGVCSSLVPVVIQKNNDLTVNTATTMTACASVANGTITVTPTNGFTPFNYQVDGLLPQQGGVPYVFNNQLAGSHTLLVTDSTGCSTNLLTVIVPIGPGVNGTTSTTIASCAGVPNGSITATATAGRPPFSWQLDGGAVLPGASPHLFSNVSAGPHSVTIIDSFGCSKNISVTVNAGAGVNGNTSSTPASCQAVSNGTVTATAIGGNPPYVFQLDGGAFQSGPNPFVFNGVSFGPHTVVIRDNVGCLKSIVELVLVGNGPTGTGSTTGTSCSGASNGTITINASNGQAPYSYSLDGGAYQAGGNPYTFMNVAAGPHTVLIKDFPGCISNAVNVNVVAGPPLSTSVTKTNVLCNRGSTGVITVTPPVLGAPPFHYSLNGVNGQGNNLFNKLGATVCYVYYRSSNGCSGSQQVTITEPTRLNSAVSMTPVRCFGESNGTITVNASGGVSPYLFSIDNGVNWQAPNIFHVIAGTYNAEVKDANGCITPQTVVVTQPQLLTAFALNSNATCDGGNDGRIIVNVSGGNSNYVYSLDGSNFQPSNQFNLGPGNYNVTVKDGLGCQTIFATTVGLTFNLFIDPLSQVDICNGTSKFIPLNTNGTKYTWWPSPGLNDSTARNPYASPSLTTRYFVNVILGRCNLYDSVIVKVNPAPVPDAGPDGDICYGQSYMLKGSGGQQFFWSPPIYLNTSIGANPVATPDVTTIYRLSVIDSIGCHSLVTDAVKVKVSIPMYVKTYPVDTIGYPGQQIQLNAVSAGISYSWSPPTGLSNTQIKDPVVTVGNIGEDVLYKVVSTDANGCKGEGFVKINVSKGPAVYVPKAFTPNHDGLNDLLKPLTVGIKALNYFRIYNRWGQIIFSTTTINQGWDGTMGGQDEPAGVYVWMLEVLTNDGKLISQKGTVMLIR